MDDWLTFLSSFPQPGEIHAWLLNQADYIGTHALYTAATLWRPAKARPFAQTTTTRGSIATPYRLPSTARNPVLNGLITLPATVPGNPHNFVLSFGPTPRVVLRGHRQAMVSGCSAVGLIVQPAVQGKNVRVFRYRKQWFAASSRHITHQRQPVATIAAPLRKLLCTLDLALQRRHGKSATAATEGHNSVFWQQCQTLTPDQCWFFRVTNDDFYFLGSYPIITCSYGHFCIATSSQQQPLLQQTLPEATPGEEQSICMQTLSYSTDHVGTIIYNPVTLAALVVTQHHDNFLLYGLIENQDSAAVMMARLVFLTLMMRPMRPDLVDVPTQDWVQTVVGPFLETHGRAHWPALYTQLTELVATLFTEAVPAWIARMQANPEPWCYPLLAALARPNREHWVPLWEGDLWVRMLASQCVIK